MHKRKLYLTQQKRQTTLPFQPSGTCSGIVTHPYIISGAKYEQEKMRELIATIVLMHEHPFSIVKEDGFIFMLKYSNLEFERISHKIMKNDCMAIYEIEKKRLKALLKNDSLVEIKGIIENVHESFKYVNHSDARLKLFSDIAQQLQLKDRKLIINCPTRWNLTYEMLFATLKFREVFPRFKDREPHYDHLPEPEDWEKVEMVCEVLKVFNTATHVISDSDYPIANLYLTEIYRVKEVIDNAAMNGNNFMCCVALSMKEKFDKYWEPCNLVMAIAYVLDSRFKLFGVKMIYPMIYHPESEAVKNVRIVEEGLHKLYAEYDSL
uniref:Zinc finger BED domain-containing protein RICESLEEPER 2-like n=1 Tax=Elaeis guineensis var. tenera TaxID=51953 RepID=A0A6J0PAD8_ELAGV|nr:zinc finger BED domain-containing protein RICESLEEPER 2-like [Elaeis guineensis]